MPSKMEVQGKSSNENGASSAEPSSNSTVEAKDINVDLLPIVHDVVRALEKDANDVSQRSKDSQEASSKIMDFNKRVGEVREDIYRLPGIETSKEEQLAQLQNLKKQLQMKKDLIAKYKRLNLKVNGLSGLHQSS